MSVPARRLILVRHGETDYNRAGRYQGHLDIPLNGLGLRQAEAIGRRLAAWPLVRCYSSDLTRSMQTAGAIAAPHGLTVEPVPELREAHLGGLQGELIRSGNALQGDAGSIVDRHDVRARPADGESVLDVRRRVRRFLRRIELELPELPPGDVVIVGHGGSLQALTAVALGLSARDGHAFRFRNCGLTIVSSDALGGPMLVVHNDCGHYEG
ncbi:MAG TPA: histidine phosphatase family protein [Thermomicrobiaceae bacterium]|nr:histidine phosphatase family protein [Thermomicrobiaceae bacterium]